MKTILLFIHIFLSISVFAQVDTIIWQQLSTLPDSPRIDFGYFLIDSSFYIVGGLKYSYHDTNTVWKYNINADQWQQMNDFPGGSLSNITGFAINGKGYACLGITPGYTNEVWEYYPEVDTWQHKSNFPDGPLSSPSPFVYNGYGYIVMGESGGSYNNARTTWRYDPISDTWDSLGLFPMSQRVAAEVVLKDSFAYLLGGFSDVNLIEYNDVWRYNINQNHWDSLGLIPGLPRESPLFWTLGNYIVGGFGLLEDQYLEGLMGSDCYSYSIDSNQWKSIVCQNFVDSIAGSLNGATFTYGKKAYFFGGYKTFDSFRGSGGEVFTLYNNVWSFDASRFLGDTITGISNITPKTIFIYPNPVTDKFTVGYLPPSTILTISDMTGQVFTTTLSGQHIDVSALPSGVYYLHIQDSGGSVVRKFVKE